MGDLIWIGNTLYPRGIVILAAIVIVLAIAGILARVGNSLPPTPSISEKGNG